MLGTNLEEIFDNIVSQESQYHGSARDKCPLKHLEQRLSNFYFEEINVKCTYSTQLSYRKKEFSDIVHVTFPEEAFIVDEHPDKLDEAKLGFLTGIPCYKYQYREVLPKSDGTEMSCVDIISKYDYGANQDEGSPITAVIEPSKETKKYVLDHRNKNVVNASVNEMNKFDDETNSLVQNFYFDKIKVIFQDAKKTSAPGQKECQYIYIPSKCLLIGIKYSRCLIGRDLEKAEKEYHTIIRDLHNPELFQEEFNSSKEWQEEQEFRNKIDSGMDQHCNNWIKLMINFDNKDGLNVRFLMDASLRRDILLAAAEAVGDEKGFKKIFYRIIYQQHSVCLPQEVAGCLKFKSTMCIAPENNDSYPDILKVIGSNNTSKCFIILQQKDYKVKIIQKLDAYRRKHGIPLVRITFDFDSGIFHENHIPLCT